MKTKVWAVLAMLSIGQIGYAKGNAKDIISQFKDEKQVENVTVPGFHAHGVTSVQVLDLSDCKSDVKERFVRACKDLTNQGYELMVRENEDDGSTFIYTKTEDNAIRELVVVSTGDECNFVLISGKINPGDMDDVIASDK